MVQMINGRLMFVYGSPKKNNKPNLRISLIGVLLGVFLLPQVAYFSDITPEKLIELTNRQRQSAGLNSLTANQLLTKAAILKAQDIIAANTFSHTINEKKFSGWIKDAGYNYSYAGENLAMDFVSAEGVIDAWNNSPAHKKNLLSPYYGEIGVAVVAGKFKGQDTLVVTEEFGAPALNASQSITQNYGLNYSRAGLVAPEILLNYPSVQLENLITHAVLAQEPLPLSSNKLILPAAGYPVREMSKFFVQPDYSGSAGGFILLFAFLTLIYLLIFLYYYYFLKISKLISA